MKDRLSKGLPAHAPEIDPKLYEHLYKFEEKELVRPVMQTEFYPDLEERKAHLMLPKNYIVKQPFGLVRNLVKIFEDPHPQKYGGQFGLQTLKDKQSETFQAGMKSAREIMHQQWLESLSPEQVEFIEQQKQIEMNDRNQEIKLQNLNLED